MRETYTIPHNPNHHTYTHTHPNPKRSPHTYTHTALHKRPFNDKVFGFGDYFVIVSCFDVASGGNNIIFDFYRGEKVKKGTYFSTSKTKYDIFFLFQVFEGNWVHNKPATHLFHEPIFSKYVRIRPVKWVRSISIRLELLGSSGKILNRSIQI